MAINTNKVFTISSALFLLAYGALVIALETTQNKSTFPITLSLFLVPFLLSIYTFSLTVFSEPGYLPKLDSITRAVEDPTTFIRTKPRIESLNKLYHDLCPPEEPDAITDEYVLFLHKSPPSDKTFFACATCHIFRPTSATSHCRECNKCVYQFDHHCGFLGTCIGARNRSNFCALLFSITILCLVSISICLVNCYTFIASNPRNILSLIEWIFISLFVGFVFFEIFFAPWLLGFVTTIRIVALVGILGLVTTIVVVSNHHLPISSGVLGYLAIVYCVFMLINVFAQIDLLRKGETVKKMIKEESRPVGRLLSSPLSRSVTTTSTVLPVRTISSGGSTAKSPLPTVNEDLSSSEEIYSEEEEPLVIEKPNRHEVASTRIEPLTAFQVLTFIARGFLPTSIKSVYFESN